MNCNSAITLGSDDSMQEDLLQHGLPHDHCKTKGYTLCEAFHAY